ncbi:Leucine rich repeat-containing protein [Pelagirhabdus alkalitolerans]|uniref:Leucine rich repeat-containing protein n=1 Tax=Pelagirhabdus alkalitolerans TaxID=1612202 RepID=A0A1G6GHA6_9BACI|nr:CotH kinase family protein [Pelagirhabdus alkalitolerans]SDB81135.1 Leucine rich repeat-containing protein [Pelagirhabdus alkalitolerans]
MKRIVIIFTGLLIFSIAFTMIYSYSYQMSQAVQFEDENLEEVIRDELSVPEDDLTVGMLSNVTSLEAKGADITSLRGIEHLTELETLDLEDNFVEDVRPLQNLSELEILNLRNNEITSLEAIHFDSLRGLENLKELSLRHNVKRPDPDDGSYQYRIEDISILAGFTSLEKLSLRDNHIQDATPLNTLINLEELDLSQNPLKNGDVQFLENFENLSHLNLRESNIQDIQFLEDLDELTYLNLHSNEKIYNFTPIQDLVGLETLIIPNVPIGEHIEVLENLTNLTRLNVRNTGIEDVSVIGHLMENGALQDQPSLEVEAIIDLTENPISVEKEGQASGYAPIRDYWDNISVREPENLLSPKDQELYINEYMASNGETISDDEGNYHDWIELYNPTDESIELSGYYLSDDETNPTRWEIPEDVVIEADDYIVIWASGEDRLDNNGMHHTNFSISRQGEPIILMGPDGETTIDFIAQREVPRDRSFGRMPDGDDQLTYFNSPTPGDENDDDGFDEVLSTPRFSHQGGFYEQSFDLEIESDEGTEIYYTLDGSEPTEDSKLYDGVLSIEETLSEELPKVQTVRAVTRGDSGELSEIATHSYFVGRDVHNRFNFPVISLNTDSDNLFDEEIGIYAEGNYENRGREWEHPMAFELYEPNGVLGISQNLGVRIHGGITRNRDQKSLRFYARGSYDEDDWMHYEFFPSLQAYGDSDEEIDAFKRILLRNSGNDHNDLSFRDAFMQSLVEDIGNFAPQASRPAIAFINGEYWGIYNIRERQDEYYLESHYDGVNPDNVTILEEGSADFDKGNPDGQAHYHDMIEYIEQNGLEEDEHYQYIQTLMDVDNYMDYIISQVYLANSDWPHNNIRFWRYLTDEYDPDAVEGRDGRWRWLLYDTDHGFEMYTSDDRRDNTRGVVHDTVEWILHPEESTFLIRHLLENDEFNEEFKSRFIDYLNIHFNTDRVLHQIQQFEALYEDEMGLHLKRWDINHHDVDEWYESIDTLRYFAEERPSIVRSYLDDHFGLGESFELNIEHEQRHKGTVLVNGQDPFMYEDVDYDWIWQGIYYESTPIHIEPQAEEGYEFIGWENDEYDKDEEIVVSSDTLLQPIFEEIDTTYYVSEAEGVRNARILNYILSYTLALLLGALSVWTLAYFAPKHRQSLIKAVVILLFLVSIGVSIPILVEFTNVGFALLTDAFSIGIFMIVFSLGGLLGLLLPKNTKEIRVFNA